MGKKILITTVAGNTIMDSDSYIGSDINGNLYAKKAFEINIGEKLYFKKEAIEKTLDDIENDLMESPRYKVARSCLFIEEQTALSYHLNNSHKLMNLDDEEKVLVIYDLVKDNIKSRQTVKNWLSGNVIMPKDKQVLTLLSEIAPELESYKNVFLAEDITKKEMIDGIEIEIHYGHERYNLYDLYINIRRGIMHYLAPAKGEGG
ncbi:hypothetical protein GQ472_02430 [archaeon]|nr:hypothetical protein [archaeon]